MFNGLAEHQALIFQGDYQKIDDETGESTAQEEIL